MKVLLVNGSPHPQGCTFTALEEVSRTLNAQGIDTEIFHIGAKPLAGCSACGYCNKECKCVYDDTVNQFVALAAQADGFIFGSPVHYAAASGGMTSFMDRIFYSVHKTAENPFSYKPSAAVVSARRGGTTAALDQLNKYFSIMQMPIVTSSYWNMVHGNTPDEVMQDLEGLQIMRNLGRNMAWLLKCQEAGKIAGVEMPQREAKLATNFIR